MKNKKENEDVAFCAVYNSNLHIKDLKNSAVANDESCTQSNEMLIK